MIHRRCLYDDSRGVDEPLNELGPDGNGLTTLTSHYLFFE